MCVSATCCNASCSNEGAARFYAVCLWALCEAQQSGRRMLCPKECEPELPASTKRPRPFPSWCHMGAGSFMASCPLRISFPSWRHVGAGLRECCSRRWR